MISSCVWPKAMRRENLVVKVRWGAGYAKQIGVSGQQDGSSHLYVRGFATRCWNGNKTVPSIIKYSQFYSHDTLAWCAWSTVVTNQKPAKPRNIPYSSFKRINTQYAVNSLRSIAPGCTEICTSFSNKTGICLISPTHSLIIGKSLDKRIEESLRDVGIKLPLD